MSHLTELCGTTLKKAPLCLVCSAKGDGKQSLAICSHFRRSVGFLKSRPGNETVLCLIKSLLSVLLLPISLFIAPSFNLPLLSISLFICRVLCCLSSTVDSLSLYAVRLFYFAASSCGSLTAHASQPLPPCGMDAGKVVVTSDRLRLTLI